MSNYSNKMYFKIMFTVLHMNTRKRTLLNKCNSSSPGDHYYIFQKSGGETLLSSQIPFSDDL